MTVWTYSDVPSLNALSGNTTELVWQTFSCPVWQHSRLRAPRKKVWCQSETHQTEEEPDHDQSVTRGKIKPYARRDAFFHARSLSGLAKAKGEPLCKEKEGKKAVSTHLSFHATASLLSRSLSPALLSIFLAKTGNVEGKRSGGEE